MTADVRVLLTIHENGVAVATLNRPDVLNAVDEDMRTALAQVGSTSGQLQQLSQEQQTLVQKFSL